MKIQLIALLLLAIQFASPRSVHDYTELVTELKKPAVEVVVAQLMGSFRKEEVTEIVGGEAYNIARTGVGCASGIFGGLDTGFTIADIIQQDPTDPGAYIFAVLFTIAWWQQNGQYLEYMCTNFWRLIHE